MAEGLGAELRRLLLLFGRREAMTLLQVRRPQAHFPQVYLDSVEPFMAEWETK